MANSFLMAQQQKELLKPFGVESIPDKLASGHKKENQEFLNDVNLAEKILDLAEEKKVFIILLIYLQSGHQNFHKTVFPKIIEMKYIINLPLLIVVFCAFVKLIGFFSGQLCVRIY